MIFKFNNNEPVIAKNVYTAPGSKIIGDVIIEENSSIWYNAVIRGDMDKIKIGKKTNIQENSTLHVDVSTPLTIGNEVTVGHGAILHGCKINDNCLIGMGAKVLNNAEIGKNTIIGAGTVITENKNIPPNSLVLGVPGKIVREIEEKQIKEIKKSAQDYFKLAQKYNNQ